MTFEEKCELYKTLRLKKIRSQELAKLCGVSNSWISQVFNKEEAQFSEAHRQLIEDYVNSK